MKRVYAKTIKAITSVALVIVMSFSLFSVVSATTMDAHIEPETEALLISSETIIVDGISITIKTYDDQGRTVETYSANNNARAANITQNAIDAAIEEVAKARYDARVGGTEEVYRAAVNFPFYSQYDNVKGSDTYRSVQAGSFVREIPGMSPYSMGVENGYSVAWYLGAGPAPNFSTIMNRFTIADLAPSISWPPSFGIGSSSKEYVWQSAQYTGTYVSTSWEDFYADAQFTLGIWLGITCYTRADFYYSNTSYPSSVTDSKTWVSSW